LNKHTDILDFFFDQKLNNNNNNNKNILKSNTLEDIFNLKNMEYTTPPKILPQILVSDSQEQVSSSTPSSHPSPYIASLSSPIIQSLIINSNTSTQASNVLETFELEPIPLIFLILSKENPNAISVQFQQNQ
jgi:hypothetical protein